jgi:hypothetical protein
MEITGINNLDLFNYGGPTIPKAAMGEGRWWTVLRNHHLIGLIQNMVGKVFHINLRFPERILAQSFADYLCWYPRNV